MKNEPRPLLVTLYIGFGGLRLNNIETQLQEQQNYPHHHPSILRYLDSHLFSFLVLTAPMLFYSKQQKTMPNWKEPFLVESTGLRNGWRNRINRLN